MRTRGALLLLVVLQLGFLPVTTDVQDQSVRLPGVRETFDHPNIIVIMLDDGDVDTQGLVTTTNIDTLKSQGITFTDFWVNPGCQPMRMSFMTGMEPVDHGAWQASNSPAPDTSAHTFVGERMAPRYQIGFFGKWMPDTNSTTGRSHDFLNVDRWAARMANTIGGSGASWFSSTYAAGDKGSDLSSTAFSTYFGQEMEDEATDWLDNTVDRSRPYLLFYWPHNTHDITTHRPPPTSVDCAISEWTCIQEMMAWEDTAIGEVLTSARAIDDANLTNTLVIFLSGDNGENSHNPNLEGCGGGASGKGNLCADALQENEVTFAYWKVPASLRNTTSTAWVTSTDFVPTLMGIIGRNPYVESRGQNLTELFLGECQGGNCYDGGDRCIFMSGQDNENVDAKATDNYRTVACNHGDGNGYQYWVNDAGDTDWIYLISTPTAECVGSACDDAKTALKALMDAHDDLPLP